MHFTELAPIYLTMPIAWLRGKILQGHAGAGLVIVGRAAKALAQTLDTQAVVFDDVEPLEALASRLRNVLPPGRVDRLVVVTDPDAADVLLDNPECLLDLGMRFRRGLIIPVVGESRVEFAGSTSLSAMEFQGDVAWRWISSKAARGELIVHNSGPPIAAHLRFTCWFSPFARRSRSRDAATLTCEVGQYSCKHLIRMDHAYDIPVPLPRGYVTVAFQTSLKAGPSKEDSRMLSMALVSPQLVDEAGRILLATPQFAEANLSLPLVARRERLHRAGFYAVGGLVCGNTGERRQIAQTFGSPQFGLHLAESDRALAEPVAGAGEVTWVVAGQASAETMT